MFLAIRDIRFAKGRFALMGGVVALITLLLVMLSGLTAGLGNQSTSAIAALPVQQIVFGAPMPCVLRSGMRTLCSQRQGQHRPQQRV